MKNRYASPTKAALPHINVTPLIDVLLVLLIIFMVISPLRPSRFKTTIPEPLIDDEMIYVSPRTLIVDVGRDSRVKLIRANETIAEGWVNDSGAVAARLAQEFTERKIIGSWKVGLENSPEVPAAERIERTVFLKAPRSIGYGEVAKVIDGIKGAGASPVGLQIDELID
jgi:biopolymer transport protein ExbD